MLKGAGLWIGLVLLGSIPLTQSANAQGRGAAARAASSGAAAEKGDEGIPVTDPLVISKCGGCHAQDDKGVMTRISFVRTTPEGWEQALKRMVRLNGLVITPEEARSVVRYLATWHGLAPEEAKPVMYIPEHRIQDETSVPNDTVRDACVRCHAFGRALSWRRTKADWGLLADMHTALYSQTDAGFRRRPPPPAGAAAPDASQNAAPQQEPRDVAVEYLAKNAPLNSPEWAAWKPRIRPARITGSWLVTATVAGKGKFVGEMIVEAGPADDQFKTSVTLKSLKDGSVIKRSGTGVVYAGYSWRGKSAGTRGKQPDDLGAEARETMWIAPDQSYATGRWFWGEYQEFGFDVTLKRVTTAPAVGGVDAYAIKAGTKGAQIKVYGDNFPANVTPKDLDFGAGITVGKIASQSKTELVVQIEVAPDAVSGKRDVGVTGAFLENAFAVYRKLDYITVGPETALAHLGSETHPKGYQQFEATGFENGPDGKAGTPDDVALGPVPVKWSLEEFIAVQGDDDVKFVGKMGETGFFNPASDGPNPARKFGRNNYGDVWATATSTTEKDSSGKPLAGRSYLIVTVPLYLRWDQTGVNEW